MRSRSFTSTTWRTLYIETAKKYDHSAIFVQPDKELYLGRPANLEVTQWILETIREKSGDEYYLMMHGAPTWAIPNGENMIEFAAQMIEEPEKLNEKSK